MGRGNLNRPKIDNTDDDLFKISNIKLDKRILGTPEDIIAYARKYNMINNNYLEIEQIINENEELELSFEDIEDDGQIKYNTEIKKYQIIINKNHHKNRQRFTMSHEYIHYQNNRDIIQKNAHSDRILYREQTIRLGIDIIANQYAAEILMPTENFRQIMQTHKGKILEIAKIFGVSTIAVRYKADNLGYDYDDL